MKITWCLCDLIEGYVIAELPLDGSVVRRELSTAGDASWSFGPTDQRTPPGWHDLIEKGRTMIVAILDGEPVQAWPITTKAVGTDAPTIGGPTLEGLLDRVYVRDYEAYGKDEAAICAEIANQVFAPGFNFATTANPSGTVRDIYYDGTQDLAIRTVLDEYATSEPPLEFACSVRWVTGSEGARVAKHLIIGPALGEQRPSVIFDSASIKSYRRTGSFAEGFGATRVWAVADGTGDTRPMEGPYESPRLAAFGPWESRPSFASVDDEVELAKRGRQSLAQLDDGTEVWEFVLNLDTAPRVGREWDIGDTVTFKVAPSANDPVGGTFSGRVLAWELDVAANTITPTLAQEGPAQ